MLTNAFDTICNYVIKLCYHSISMPVTNMRDLMILQLFTSLLQLTIDKRVIPMVLEDLTIAKYRNVVDLSYCSSLLSSRGKY